MLCFCDNRNCLRVVGFHIECVDKEEDIPEGALYLSGDCEREKSTRMTNEKTTAWIRYVLHCIF